MGTRRDETDSRSQPQGAGSRAGVDEALAALPREIVAPTDLWPAIEMSIRGEDDDRDLREDDDRDLRLTALPQSVSPPEDLWPRIAAEVTRDQSIRPADSPRRWATLPRVAASVAVLAIVGAAALKAGFFGGLFGPSTQPGRTLGPAAALNVALEDLLPPGAIYPGFTAADETSAEFENARQIYLDQITAVRAERETIETSLARYPDEPTLLSLWLHTYETELLLIDEASRVLTDIQTGWHS